MRSRSLRLLSSFGSSSTFAYPSLPSTCLPRGRERGTVGRSLSGEIGQGREERSDGLVLHSAIANNLQLVASLLTRRYLRTWFIVDMLSMIPWETFILQPIVDMQNRRGFFSKSFFRTKGVVKVTRVLRGRHFKLFGKVSSKTKYLGVGASKVKSEKERSEGRSEATELFRKAMQCFCYRFAPTFAAPPSYITNNPPLVSSLLALIAAPQVPDKIPTQVHHVLAPNENHYPPPPGQGLPCH